MPKSNSSTSCLVKSEVVFDSVLLSDPVQVRVKLSMSKVCIIGKLGLGMVKAAIPQHIAPQKIEPIPWLMFGDIAILQRKEEDKLQRQGSLVFDLNK